MPSNTPNLGLYKKDPVTDGNDTFNVTSMLNENWDKIDQDKKAQDDAHAAHLADGMPDGVHGIATIAALTLYVDAALGDDANTGLAAGAGYALKTIQAAINKIPQIVNHMVTINVAAGTYAETISIRGFVGSGNIIVNGGTDLASASNYLINYIYVLRCFVPVTIKGFKANIANSLYDFFVNQSSTVVFQYCISTTTTPNGFYFQYCPGGQIYNCQTSNHINSGIVCILGNLDIYDCFGNNNQYGVFTGQGGHLGIWGSTYPGLRVRGSYANSVENSGGISAPTGTWANMFLYVRPDGSDDNDGSANDAAHALKTISEAIRRLPPRIDHTVTINVAAGTYNEIVNINGFIGNGNICLYGDTSVSDSYVVTQVYVSKCTCYVEIRGIKATITTSEAFYIGGCTRVLINYCKVDAATTGYSAIYAISSFCTVQNSSLSNRSAGIYTFSSVVFSNTNTGSGNTYGLRASDASKIGKGGTQPGGTTAEYVQNGGQIVA